MREIKRRLQALWGLSWHRSLACLVAVLTVGCGGGGGGGGGGGATESATPPPAGALAANAEVIALGSEAQTAVQAVTRTDAGQTVLHVPGSGVLASQAVGRIVSIDSGVDPRFPLGLSGRIAQNTTLADGSHSLELVPAKLTEVLQALNLPSQEVALTRENFVGVISPAAVKSIAVDVDGHRMYAVGEWGRARRASAAPLAVSDPTALGNVSIDVSFDLKELADGGQQQPISADSKLTINGSLSNLKLTRAFELETIAGIPTGLKSTDVKVTGDLTASLMFTGSFDLTIGTWTNAWKEVEEVAFRKLGVSGKFNGLDAKDKIGKFPIAGLVYAVKCPPPKGCLSFKSSSTPLMDISSGGVIVWVYLTSSGRLAVDGSAGVRLNQGQFEIGMNKPEGGDMDVSFQFKRTGTNNLIEAPVLNGEVRFEAKTGIEIEIDTFAPGGLWFGSAGAFFGTQFNSSVNTAAGLLYGTPALAGPWAWAGQACLNYSFGGGALAHAKVSIGATIKTRWKDITGSFEYAGAWPSPDELSVEGSHNILGIPAWTTLLAKSGCFPEPSVTDISPSSAALGAVTVFKVTGTALPLNLLAQIDDGATACGNPFEVSSSGFSLTCTPGGPAGLRRMAISSNGVAIQHDKVVDFTSAPALLPQIVSFTFSLSGALGPAGVVRVVFDTDMKPQFSTYGNYVPAANGNQWPNLRTYELHLASYTPGGAITLQAGGFVSVTGGALAADRSLTFPTAVPEPVPEPVPPTSQNLFLGAPVTDSSVGACAGCGVAANLTDGLLATGYTLPNVTGHFAVLLDAPQTIALVRFTPKLAQGGTMSFDVRTSNDPAGSVGTFVSRFTMTLQAQDGVPIDLALPTSVPGVRIVQIIVTQSPALLGAYEIEGYADALNASTDHLAIPTTYDNVGSDSGIYGQSFTAVEDRISGVTFYFGDPTRPGDSRVDALTGRAELKLYEVGTNDTVTLLAASTVSDDTAILQGAKSLFFNAPVTLVPGRRYFIGVQASDNFGLGLSDLTSSTYPGGAEAWILTGESRLTMHPIGRDTSFRVLKNR